jgi:hypothetical protein
MKRWIALVRNARGAVYVELMIAFMPVFTFFLCLLQLAFVYTTRVFVEHTATAAARVAALSLGRPQPGENLAGGENPVALGPQREALVRKAALLTLAPLILDGTINSVVIEPTPTPYAAMSDDGSPILHLKVRAQMECKVMIANRLICHSFGGGGGSFLHPSMWLSAESLFPVERAHYEPAAACQ